MKVSKTDIVKAMASAINMTMGSPCDVSVALTSTQKYKLTFEGFPVYPSGDGYLILTFPQDFFELNDWNEIKCRQLLQTEIRLFNGKTENTTKALIHTNIFDDGHPCLGQPNGVLINSIPTLASYFISAALRRNMTRQSFLSPTTRKYGNTPAEMAEFKEKVRNLLAKKIRRDIVDMDTVDIYDAFSENFRDAYRAVVR